PAGSLKQWLIRSSLVIDAITAPQYGLLISEEIVSKTDARRPVISVVALKQRAIADTRRADLGSVFRMDELSRTRITVIKCSQVCQEVKLFMSDTEEFITHAQIKGQARVEFPIVLSIESVSCRAEVKRRKTRSSLSACDAAQKKILKSTEGRQRTIGGEAYITTV